ncbi:UNVERIFIED_CONTAM: hypothetical protein GTU68_052632, partial [Idotea baltica]|nr:hypothetical protein [Idotea baltica]
VSVIVQKFGGTSVADATRICAAAQRAVDTKRDGKQVIMVVSARGKKTDELVGLAAEITSAPQPREMDMLLSTGEQESVALMAMAIHELGEKAISMTGGQIGVVTDSSHTKARIQAIDTQRLRDALDSGAIVIAAGFQGVDDQRNITTLGRGGSDTTATALAAVIHADLCEIYTDVEGVFTTDPRMVKNARKVERISYDEMLELASLGAGVMHSRSIEFAKKYRVPLRVRHQSQQHDTAATERDANVEREVVASLSNMEDIVVSNVQLDSSQARVSISNLPDAPGVAADLFSTVAEGGVMVDMIIQSAPVTGTASLSFTVPGDQIEQTVSLVQTAMQQWPDAQISHDADIAKLSVMGIGLRSHTGVGQRMFQALADASINVQLINTSEIRISAVVSSADGEKAKSALLNAFQLV